MTNTCHKLSGICNKTYVNWPRCQVQLCLIGCYEDRSHTTVHVLIPCMTKHWYTLSLSNLGVYTAANSFNCSYDNVKVKFYRAFNSLCCRIACSNCELVYVELIKAHGLPMLLYAVESTAPSRHKIRMMDRFINICQYICWLFIWKFLRYLPKIVHLWDTILVWMIFLNLLRQELIRRRDTRTWRLATSFKRLTNSTKCTVFRHGRRLYYVYCTPMFRSVPSINDYICCLLILCILISILNANCIA